MTSESRRRARRIQENFKCLGADHERCEAINECRSHFYNGPSSMIFCYKHANKYQRGLLTSKTKRYNIFGVKCIGLAQFCGKKMRRGGRPIQVTSTTVICRKDYQKSRRVEIWSDLVKEAQHIKSRDHESDSN